MASSSRILLWRFAVLVDSDVLGVQLQHLETEQLETMAAEVIEYMQCFPDVFMMTIFQYESRRVRIFLRFFSFVLDALLGWFEFHFSF